METGGCKDPLNAEGDGGRSLGPYQISERYFNDAVKQNPSLLDGGRSYANVIGPGSDAYSRDVMQGYMDQYATESRLGHMPTDEDIARIHNGGPNGYKNPNTNKYWVKVNSNLDFRKRQAADREPYIGCAECDDAINESIFTPCSHQSMDVAKKTIIFLAFAVVFFYLYMY